MDKSKISIIVPVYNTEEYLPKCLDNIIGQTYKNLEIILVNDGSTDNSLLIINEYAAKDSRIIVIDIDNGGLGRARNKGLDICTGDYIMFCDSDDWYDLDICENLINAIKLNDYDFAMCGIREINSKGKIIKKYFEFDNNLEVSRNELLNRYFTDHKLISSAVNKIYNKKLFINLRYPERMYYEDRYLSVDLFLYIERVIFTGKVMYNYYRRKGSISHNSFSNADIDYVNVLVRDKEILGYISEENKNNSKYYVADAVFGVIVNVLIIGRNKNKEKYNYLYDILKADYEKIENKKDKKYYKRYFTKSYLIYRIVKHFIGRILRYYNII